MSKQVDLQRGWWSWHIWCGGGGPAFIFGSNLSIFGVHA